MKQRLGNIVLALLTFGLGLGLTSLAQQRFGNGHHPEIPPQPFLAPPSCIEEEETPQDFSAYWVEFRNAVDSEDKAKLFALTRKCGFDWSPFTGRKLVKPLETDLTLDPSPQLESPFDVNRTSFSSWGGSMKFKTYEDFLSNYEVIFSERNRQRLLMSNPGSSTECEFAINWREKVLNHLCFDKVGESGFKFSGITYEP